MTQHPVRKLPYDQLFAQLQEAVSFGQVREHIGEENLRLYCYTDQTVYERQWHSITMMARGLVIDTAQRQVVATPFPKFFNYHEVTTLPENLQQTINLNDFLTPFQPLEIFEKLDGSLIIIFWHNGRWKCSTKGSLSSDQAKWAQVWLHSQPDLSYLLPGTTYLAEAIYPENRIVVNYGTLNGLVLLGAYDATGMELSTNELLRLADSLQWKMAKSYAYDSVPELLEKAATLSSNDEGFVVKSHSGQRIKIKGAEYCRVHRLISNLTPLSIWRALKDQEDLTLFRKSLPEEFWQDFDRIIKLFDNCIDKITSQIDFVYQPLLDLSDKEIGLRLHTLPEEVRSFIFPYRKYGTEILQNPKSRHGIFESFRPARNILPGYVPSSSVVRAQNDNE